MSIVLSSRGMRAKFDEGEDTLSLRLTLCLTLRDLTGR